MRKRVAMAALSPLLAETLQNGGEVSLTVTGRSMLPLLHHGRDRVCLVKPPAGRLKKYDIALFVRRDGQHVLHRVVAVKAGGYVVIGDHQAVKEYPVRPAQVLGVVKGFWRDGRYVSCEHFWYRMYCRLWVFWLPLRRLYLRWKRSRVHERAAD